MIKGILEMVQNHRIWTRFEHAQSLKGFKPGAGNGGGCFH